ncbi:MAG: hypothetical protein FWF63_02095 [Fibromonadales bacterium]|nr:hypothetical protein [Fibromonadales bacterium]
MIEWCVNFIAGGFWQAILFMVIFNLICSSPRLIFKKNPLVNKIFSLVPSIISCFIIWKIRNGTGWLIFGIIGIIGFIVSIIGVVFEKMYKITDENIGSFAEGQNSNLPKDVDKITRCEKIKTMPGKVWIYQMTVLNQADLSKIAVNLNSDAVRQNILNNIKTAADMKVFRDSDVTICYEYSDEAGNILATLKFAPSDYKG